MNAYKNVFKSVTVLASILMFIAGLLGWEMEPEEAHEIAARGQDMLALVMHNAEALALMIGSVVTIIGRVRARTKLVNPVTGTAPADKRN